LNEWKNLLQSANEEKEAEEAETKKKILLQDKEKKQKMIKIKILSGGLCGKLFEFDKQEIIIGRDKSCDIIIPEKVVSRTHAKIFQKEGSYLLQNCRSSFGTYLNGSRVEEHKLAEGDKITIGKTVFVFQPEEDEEAIQPPILKAIRVDTIKSMNKIGDIRSTLCAGNFSLAALSDKKVDIFPVEKIKDEDLNLVKTAHLKLSILYEISSALHSILDLDTLLKMVMDLTMEAIGFDKGYLLLIDEKTGELIPRVVKTKNIADAELEQVSISKTITDEVIKKKEAILTLDAQSDIHFDPGQSIFAYDIRSAMCAPLWDKSKVIGVIFIHNQAEDRTFNEDDLNFLVALANEAAIAIENAKLYKNIEKETRIRTNLQRFFSPSIVDEITNKKEEITLGGKKGMGSIFFTDIRGFTSLTLGMEPQMIVEILNEYFTVLTKCLFKYEGTLDKFIGDGLLAIFGAPRFYPDFTYRAVCCALEVREELKTLNKIRISRGEKPIPTAISIATGEMVTGIVGSPQRMEYTVYGEIVNLASRLVSIAKENQIVICKNTYLDIMNKVEVIPLEEITVKGFKEPLKIYEVANKG